MDKRREQGKKKLVEFGFGLTILRDSVALDSMCVDRGDSGGGRDNPSITQCDGRRADATGRV